ncbi:hypothetical protein Pmani_015643 [Petrolisthes manimaculis]|uniref:Uncharacterized protein n=1 Tax=Petrolisthes manimaculis TaxID=1843537 RepID=A0AAE1U773_9EUCA|nr:hypothetical protein Pmani_015643 [Petrolisthes manimaculis]
MGYEMVHGNTNAGHHSRGNNIDFLRDWDTNFGPSAVIISDQGTQLESRAWQDMLQYLCTQRQRMTTYHLQSNGWWSTSTGG